METKQRNNGSPTARKQPPKGRGAGKSVPGKPAGRPKQPAAADAVRRPRSVTREQTKRKTAQESKPASISPDVVYLPPKPFSRHRLLLGLAIAAAVVLAVVLGLSVFFKVDADKIMVSGTNKYTAWDVAHSSGIQEGDNLVFLNRARAAGKIKDALKYVKDVRIGIKLPDTVNIEIVEVEVTYAVKGQDESWWLLSSEGRVIEQAPAEGLDSFPKILGIQLDSPKAGEPARAVEETQTETGPDGELLPLTVTAAQRLSTAVDIAGFLEANGVIGQVKSIDVNNMGDIQLWYESRYQVLLGDKTALAEKISTMKAFIDRQQQEAPHASGILDASKYPEKAVFSSF